MRGFQKGITLGIGTSGSAFEVAGAWGGLFNYSVSPVQSGVGVWSSEFGVGLDLDWNSA